MNEFYEILEIPKDSPQLTIKKTYLTLALRHYPKKFELGRRRAEKNFTELSRAFAVLSDEDLRSIYDNSGYEVAKENCEIYDLNNFSLENAYSVLSLILNDRDPISICLDDDCWYENEEIFNGGLINRNISILNKKNQDIEVVETSMSRYSSSPRNLQKSVKRVTVEKDGKRVKKTITTVLRADGTQETTEEEKEEDL